MREIAFLKYSTTFSSLEIISTNSNLIFFESSIPLFTLSLPSQDCKQWIIFDDFSSSIYLRMNLVLEFSQQMLHFSAIFIMKIKYLQIHQLSNIFKDSPLILFNKNQGGSTDQFLKFIGLNSYWINIIYYYQNLMKNKSCPIANNSKFCQLCNSPTREQLLLLAYLRKRLYTKYISESREKNINTKKTTNTHLETNRRLFQIILGSTLTESSIKCTHEKYFNLFKRKLRCSNNVLVDICEDLIMKMGNRNYQLDILSQQINTLPKTINSMMKDVSSPKKKEVGPEIKVEEGLDNEDHKNLQNTRQKQRNEPAGGNQLLSYQNSSNINMSHPKNFMIFPYFYPFPKKPQGNA